MGRGQKEGRYEKVALQEKRIETNPERRLNPKVNRLVKWTDSILQPRQGLGRRLRCPASQLRSSPKQPHLKALSLTPFKRSNRIEMVSQFSSTLNIYQELG